MHLEALRHMAPRDKSNSEPRVPGAFIRKIYSWVAFRAPANTIATARAAAAALPPGQFGLFGLLKQLSWAHCLEPEPPPRLKIISRVKIIGTDM